MHMGIATSPAAAPWRELYKAALFETDKSKLLEYIVDAEMAMVLRARELFHTTDGDHIEEEEALDDAMYALRALRSIAGSSFNDRNLKNDALEAARANPRGRINVSGRTQCTDSAAQVHGTAFFIH